MSSRPDYRRFIGAAHRPSGRDCTPLTAPSPSMETLLWACGPGAGTSSRRPTEHRAANL